MGLFIFDKDGTLVNNHNCAKIPHNPTRPEEQVLLPGVFEKLADLRSGGHRLAIATNQSMVAHGTITMEEAQELVENCAAKAGGMNAWRISGYSPRGKQRIKGAENPYARDDETRKPHPGMLFELMAELGFTPDETTMVGDSKKDRNAAHAAGVKFIWAKYFFKT